MGTIAPSRSHQLLFAAWGLGIIAFASIYYVFAWSPLVSLLTFCKEVFCDFANCFYPMGEALFRVEQPVGCFIYSPFAALLFSSFAQLELQTSLVAWGVVQTLSIVLLLLTFRRLVQSATLLIQLLFIALLISSYPLWLNVKAGSVGAIITVAILGALVAVDRGHRLIAAALLAFAASFKFYPLLFLVPIAFSGDRRWLLYSITASVVILFVIPALALGFDVTITFYGGLFDTFRNSDWVRQNPHSNYLPHVIARGVNLSDGPAPGGMWILTAISYTIAVINMGFVYLIQRARLAHADLWSFQIVFLTVPFVLKTSWEGDFVFLPFTQALIAWRLLWSQQGEYLNRRVLQLKAGRLFILGLSMVIPTIFFFQFLGDFVGYGSAAFLFWADLSLLVILYMELFPEARCRSPLWRMKEPLGQGT